MADQSPAKSDCRARLERAAAAGVIGSEQVGPLAQLLAAGGAGGEREPLRFLRNFGDVFITLGVALLWLATQSLVGGLVSYLIAIALFIALTEWLARRRRLRLPAIMLAFAFQALAAAFWFRLGEAWNIDSKTLWYLLMACGSALYFWRYRTPFVLLPLSFEVYAFLAQLIGLDVVDLRLTVAGYGVIIFVLGVSFDARDLKREGWFSDAAFWLHLAAAPMIAHGLATTLLESGMPEYIAQLLVIGMCAVFFFIGLYVDRRAILGSTLIYALYASIELFDSEVAVYFLGGLLVMVTGAHWLELRNALYARTSSWPLARWVPEFTARR